MILTDREILIAIEQKIISIDPLPLENAFSSTSVDLTLDSTLSVFKAGLSGVERSFDPTHPDYNHEEVLAEYTESKNIDNNDGFLFKPGELILAWTKEFVDLNIRAKLAGRVEGKSSLARLGIGVHVTAPTIHAGFSGAIRLEMYNHGKIAVRLRTGMRICQLIFEQTLGTPNRGYSGKFSGQTMQNKG